jgi:hypothetical protein
MICDYKIAMGTSVKIELTLCEERSIFLDHIRQARLGKVNRTGFAGGLNS